MGIELETMSKEELKKLKRDVEKALATIDERRKAEAIRAAEEAARQYGFSLTELKDTVGKRGKRPAKYRNPENPSETWTGRGRQPNWYKDAIESGKSPEDLLI
ncbi:MAG: H-NS family nucleoid-associated regulatory protein [Paracoccaceae bacterium]